MLIISAKHGWKAVYVSSSLAPRCWGKSSSGKDWVFFIFRKQRFWT